MTVESGRDPAGLSGGGAVAALALREMQENLDPGMKTADLNAAGTRIFEQPGVRSAPNLVYGFPGANLIRVKDKVGAPIPDCFHWFGKHLRSLLCNSLATRIGTVEHLLLCPRTSDEYGCWG